MFCNELSWINLQTHRSYILNKETKRLNTPYANFDPMSSQPTLIGKGETHREWESIFT